MTPEELAERKKRAQRDPWVKNELDLIAAVERAWAERDEARRIARIQDFVCNHHCIDRQKVEAELARLIVEATKPTEATTTE